MCFIEWKNFPHIKYSDTKNLTFEYPAPNSLQFNLLCSFSFRYFLVDAIESAKKNSTSDFFNITQNSGIVTLRQSIDHEDYQLINITVMAVDGGYPTRHSTAVVTVEVIDVNDNSPEWEVFEEVIYVWENDTIGNVFSTNYGLLH